MRKKIGDRLTGKIRSPKSTSGFTLLETLVAAVLIALIGSGIYRALTSGVLLLARTQAQEVQISILPVLDMMKEDVWNSYNTADIVFLGLQNEISFYVHETRYLLLPEGCREHLNKKRLYPIRKISYIYDMDKKNFSRREYEYNSDKPLISTELLKGLDTVLLSYKIYNEKTNEYMYSAYADKLPEAIKIEMMFQSDKYEQVPFEFLIDIPFNN